MTSNANLKLVPVLPADAENDLELRAGPRTAMFVAATCVSFDRVQPVRVRNMSRDGALLEGAVLPGEGEAFELVRAHLRVAAQTPRAA